MANDLDSGTIDVISDLPQDSVLRPLLFRIYVNYLSNNYNSV